MKYIISIVLLAFAATVNAQLVFTNESIRVAVLKGSRENKSSREFEDENAAKTITVLASQMYPCK